MSELNILRLNPIGKGNYGNFCMGELGGGWGLPRRYNRIDRAVSKIKFLYKSQSKPYFVVGGLIMRNEFTAIIEKDGDWFIAYSPEIPGANGQGKTKDECRTSLAESINLILEDRRKDTV